MNELGLTVPQLAGKAQVDATTVRAFIKGTRVLRDETRNRLLTALDWPTDELARRVWTLSAIPTADLVAELCRRFNDDHGGREKPDQGP